MHCVIQISFNIIITLILYIPYGVINMIYGINHFYVDHRGNSFGSSRVQTSWELLVTGLKISERLSSELFN